MTVVNKIQWQGTHDYLLHRGWVRKSCHGDPPVELWGSEKTLLHSNLLLRGSLGAAGSRLSPRLGQWFVSKGLYMHKQAVVLVSKDSKFGMLLITCQGSLVARNLSASRISQWGWGRQGSTTTVNYLTGDACAYVVGMKTFFVASRWCSLFILGKQKKTHTMDGHTLMQILTHSVLRWGQFGQILISLYSFSWLSKLGLCLGSTKGSCPTCYW